MGAQRVWGTRVRGKSRESRKRHEDLHYQQESWETIPSSMQNKDAKQEFVLNKCFFPHKDKYTQHRNKIDNDRPCDEKNSDE